MPTSTRRLPIHFRMLTAGCPPRGLPRATRSQRRQAPAPTGLAKRPRSYRRGRCLHPAASIGTLSYVDGGLRAGRPTTPQAAFPRTCRGRRLRRPVSAGCRQAPAPTTSQATFPRTCRGDPMWSPVNTRSGAAGRRRGTRAPPYNITRGFGRICRGRCPHRPVNIRKFPDRRGGVRAPRPTTRPRAFRFLVSIPQSA